MRCGLCVIGAVLAVLSAGCGAGPESRDDGTAEDADINHDASDIVETAPLYRNDGTHLRDSMGRAIMLRGINFPSDDVDHWAGEPVDQDKTDINFIAASGFNAIRLVINWDRIEPDPDTYDAAYIALIARHARLAWEAGLYVIIDLHQDMYGMGFGLHGAPYWTCDPANYDAFEPIEPWFFNYYSEEVSACFDGFWKGPDLQSHHHRAAAELAKSLTDIDGVLGFDPHNEPFPGTIQFEEFERDYLGPFYDNFGAAIEDVLPGRIVFFEPAVVFSVAQDTSFTATESAPAKFFFPHYYNMTVETNLEWDGNVGADLDWITAAANQADKLKVPWGIGEMGGNTDATNLDQFLLSFYDLLDQKQAASFLWLFNRGTGGFGLIDSATNDWKPVAAAFLRLAPSAVAGTPTGIRWDATARMFELDWEGDPAAGDTEIILPNWVDVAGYTVQVDDVETDGLAPGKPGRLIIPSAGAGPRTLKITVNSPYPGVV